MFPKSISEFKKLREAGEITSLNLTKLYFEKIKKSTLNEYIYPTQMEEYAYERARESDDRFTAGKSIGPLDGVPMIVKDCFCLAGFKTTNASKILENFVPPFDAHAVGQLKEAGAVFLGKGNTDEFTMGTTTESSYFGVVKNPFDETCVAGGSSGGVSAAIAGDTALCGIGTDTGGSIRLPASFCGIAGLKVTYGRVSRYGALSMASSFDTIGPMAKNCEDLSSILTIIAGRDTKDSTTSDNSDLDYKVSDDFDLSKITVGLPKEYFGEGLDSKVRQTIEEVVAWYKARGARIKEVSLPSTKYAVALYYILVPSEVSSNMSRYDGVRFGHLAEEYGNLFDLYSKSRGEGFGQEVKRRILLGTYALSAGYYDAYYNKASRVRRLIQMEFENVFEDVDVLLAPVAPYEPFKIGSKADDPLALYLADVFTVPANSSGMPSLSVPARVPHGNLPIGFQLMGKPFAEKLLLNVGNAYEKGQD